MDKNVICEALYALPGNIVEKRRKGIAIPLAAALVGAAVLASVAVMAGKSVSSDLVSVLAVFGAAMVIGGIAVTLVRIIGKGGDPYLRASGKRLDVAELAFDRTRMSEVLDKIDRGDVDALLKMEESSVASLVVVVYRSHDGLFAACQPFEYAELEYRPLRGLKVFEK